MPSGIGHDDKDPGSLNLDIGYIEAKHKLSPGQKIYKPYIRKNKVRVVTGYKIDFEIKKYGLVDPADPSKIVAMINIAEITTPKNDDEIRDYGSGLPLKKDKGGKVVEDDQFSFDTYP